MQNRLVDPTVHIQYSHIVGYTYISSHALINRISAPNA